MHFFNLLTITTIVIALTGCGDSKPPKGAELSALRNTASSQLGKYTPEGLLSAAQPGWHAQNPRKFPEWVMVGFQVPREVQFQRLLPQDGNLTRAPKARHVEISNDGHFWLQSAASDDVCSPNTQNGWSEIKFVKPVTARYLKIAILSDRCDPGLVTFRGLKFGWSDVHHFLRDMRGWL